MIISPEPTRAVAAAQSSAKLNLRPVANSCANASCPTIYDTGTGTLVVQGFTVAAERADIDVPSGEMLVEIPMELLTEAIRNLP